jgi:hypothetical protein
MIRSVIGTGLYWAMPGLLALGPGTLIRRTAGAIVALIDLVLILPDVAQGLPTSWQAHITKYLPSVAGHRPHQNRGGRPPAVRMGGLRAVLRLCRRHAHRRRHHAEPARCLTPTLGLWTGRHTREDQCAGSVPAAAEWVALYAAGAIPRHIVRSE